MPALTAPALATGYGFDERLHWYAVLEGADPDYNTLELIYRHLPAPEWLPLYQFGPYTALAKAGPVLLKLDRPGNWVRLWHESFSGLAGSLVGSEGDLQAVGHHLRTLVSVRVEGGADALFRFHDAWVMSALYPTLAPAERDRIHGPIETWLWFAGNEIRVGARPDDAASGARALEDGWLRLDSAAQDAIRQGMAAKRNWKERQP